MKSQQGFTLIEILIALAIIAISLTAALQATAVNIKNQQYLSERIKANFVGENGLRLIQFSLINNSNMDKSYQSNDFNQKKYWQVQINKNACQMVSTIQIKVLNKQFDGKSILTLKGYGVHHETP